MRAVALTGGIASGKSLAAQRFAELGVTVIDSDVVAREIVEPGEAALEAIVQRFGRGILTAEGRLNRAALRQQVFADPTARRDLEAITHPRIRALMRERARLAPGPYHLQVIPLLAESGRAKEFDRVLVIDCDPALQRARLMLRDNSLPAEADAILAAQASRAERLAIADDIIVNDGSLTALLGAIDQLHQRYLTLWSPGPSGTDVAP